MTYIKHELDRCVNGGWEGQHTKRRKQVSPLQPGASPISQYWVYFEYGTMV